MSAILPCRSWFRALGVIHKGHMQEIPVFRPPCKCPYLALDSVIAGALKIRCSLGSSSQHAAQSKESSCKQPRPWSQTHVGLSVPILYSVTQMVQDEYQFTIYT